MRRIIVAVSCLVLVCQLAAQTGPSPMKAARMRAGDVDFAGTTFRVSTDSMNDRQVCSAMTVNGGAWIAVSGDRTAMITTAPAVTVNYDRPAFLRIGSAAPFKLSMPRADHAIFIPRDKSAEVVRALYTQQRIRLRFTEYPSGGLFDHELMPGDFAAAYDRGVELCAWPKLSVAAVHPAPEHEVADPTSSGLALNPVLDLQAYFVAISRRVQANWLASARAVNVSDAHTGRCVVSFTIEPDGAVKGIAVSQSSGDRSVDSSAQRAVMASGPMPAFPGDRREPLALRAEFDPASSSLKIAP